MKFLAISHDRPGVAWDAVDKRLLELEAFRVHELYMNGKLREIYLDEPGDAVIILECRDQQEAESAVGSLPLVQNGFIGFTATPLFPYRGLLRIINCPSGPEQTV